MGPGEVNLTRAAVISITGDSKIKAVLATSTSEMLLRKAELPIMGVSDREMSGIPATS
jgi:hypothetical protein